MQWDSGSGPFQLLPVQDPPRFYAHSHTNSLNFHITVLAAVLDFQVPAGTITNVKAMHVSEPPVSPDFPTWPG